MDWKPLSGYTKIHKKFVSNSQKNTIKFFESGVYTLRHTKHKTVSVRIYFELNLARFSVIMTPQLLEMPTKVIAAIGGTSTNFLCFFKTTFDPNLTLFLCNHTVLS